jgi:hypothetical protein
MAIHIGSKIKDRAKELRIGATELGKKVNTTKQNIYGIYKRHSLDTDLLLKICKALDQDFFLYYSKSVSVTEPKGEYLTKDKISSFEATKKENEMLKKEIAELRDKIQLQKKMIALLERKK